MVMGDVGELVRVGYGCERGHRVERVCVGKATFPTIKESVLLRDR